MTRQILRVTVRPWRIGYLYRATLSDHDSLSSRNSYAALKGWRLTRSGIERSIRRRRRRRQRRINWHNRNWERILADEEPG